MQSLVGVLVQVAKVVTKMMNTFLPAINQLQRYLVSVDDLNLAANSEFSEVCSRHACFLCFHGGQYLNDALWVNCSAHLLFPRWREEWGQASLAKRHSSPCLKRCAVTGSWLCSESPNSPPCRSRAPPHLTTRRGRRWLRGLRFQALPVS